MEVSKERGFTILELVVVIAIIGILAAVAIPRFMDLSERAHDAAVEGTQTALASAVSMSKGAWMSMGRNIALNDVIFPGGNEDDPAFGIDTNELGWPSGTAKTTASTGDNNTVTADDCAALWVAFLESNAPTVTTDGAATFAANDVDYIAAVGGDGTYNGCKWSYLRDEEDDSTDRRFIEYDARTGKVSVDNLWIDDNVKVAE